MKISPSQYAQSLLEVMAEAPKGKEKIFFDNFLNIVENNNDIKALPHIIEEIRKIGEEKSGFKRAAVTSAISLSDEIKNAIIEKLEKTFKAKVKISETVKPEVLGGVMIEAGDEVLDATIRTMINKFKHNLSI